MRPGIITNIGTLVAVPPGPLRGRAMRELPAIREATMVLRDGRIEWFGPRREAPAWDGEELDAGGGCVTPALIDCHTHIPFVGDRSDEFVRRIGGESYLSIMQAGGGIRATTRAVRAASEDDLVRENLPRLARMLAEGVATIECKSGYGLSPEPELKQLRAMRRLKGMQPIDIVSTYMGAHALPAEFEGRPDAYVNAAAADELMGGIAREGLAEFCDVFCDRGAFDVPQSRRVLESGLRHGLRAKLHADELAQIGASRLAGELGAVSADHLEHIDDEGIAALRRGGTVAVVLPGTSFFLGIPHAPARRLIESGLAVALATDCNPGSCTIESLPLIMNIACCQLRLLPEEALAACTANAAAAVGRAAARGAIAVGFDADVLVLDAPDLAHWMYAPGRRATRAVIKRGRVVWSRNGEVEDVDATP